MKQFIVCSLLVIGLFSSNTITAQKSTKKYQSLFWEITGNGLKKPSYLFGTMHVSSKMVFHLNDLFYHALKSVDAVALELNPEKWQGDMFRMQMAQQNLVRFSSPELSDYINEQSFQLTKYEENLKRALSEEPTIVNSLLYRSYQSRADFEENTYLDLYIYQTGRKMGKIATGVEDYEQTEKLMLEAYQDMAREKIKRTVNTDGESMFDISRKMQDAYRKGDLDLMDSLEQLTITSPAFTEKFLYKRNEIQANSIDTILQNRSLFVGVGAAHLPGERGVIEMLRRKGYTLRPIFMQDRDASQKDEVDKMRVPVTFDCITSDDGFIKVKVPGKLFRREEARANESLQYADMNNGSYYMITRVRTHAAILGDGEKYVIRKLDSMLYENIPGKILKKTVINKNGFTGYDITNRTRRGDLQRYNIVVTPFEVLVFKMSGNDNYVEGKEAETFFSSIEFDNPLPAAKWSTYQPNHGGFAVSLPHEPIFALNKKTTDRIARWEYEAVDEKTGDAYMIWKKSVHNYTFIEEDTFDLALIDESFKKSELVDKLLSQKFSSANGVPFVDLKYALKNGQYVKARAYIKGPHYYFIAARSSIKSNEFPQFFNSFKLTDFKYNATQSFTDTIMNIQVKTAVYPDIDMSLRAIVNSTAIEETSIGRDVSYDYWPKTKNGLFKSDSTGEAIWVSVESFPKYYFSRDSARFWKERLDEKKLSRDMIIKTREFFAPVNTLGGYKISLVDTNSSRKINMQYVLKDNAFFKFVTLTDTSSMQSAFINNFIASFKPLDKKLGPSVFDDKLDLFFADYYSTDSVSKKKANAAIANIYFGKAGSTKLMKAINDLKYGQKDYFELKSKLINELGFLTDSCCVKEVTANLKSWYQRTTDTSYFQNAIINSLARLKTKESFSLLKEILIQDPPVFDNSYEYGRLFTNFSDTLALAKTLFPDVLQLAQVDDYKLRLNSLLRQLVDSGFIKASDYQSYFSKLYFDAKVQLKKQQIKDERILEKSTRQDDDERVIGRSSQPGASLALNDYAVLLMPFYDKNPSVATFYNRLLQSKDADVQLNALILMVKNKKIVHDSIFQQLASKDQYRAKLLAQLEKVKRTDLFPAKYKQQEDVARSLLMGDKTYDKIATVELVKKKYMQVKDQEGYVYFFKYKVKKDDDWQMGISGLQPLNAKEVSSKDDLVRMTERKLKKDESVDDQFETQLRRLVFAKHKSSRQFYSNSNYRGMFNSLAYSPD